jgi:small-conductance mechanosensitive channel
MGSSKKRKKRGSNYSVHNDSDIADETNEEMDVKSSIDALTIAMEAGFAGLRAELDKLRLEFKHEIEGMKGELKSLKESISFTQGEVDTLKEKSKENVKEMKDSLEELNKTIAVLEEKLKAAAEDNIKLEQYTRRENLRFNNIMEEEGEDCKSLIYEVIEKEMGIDTANIKFHAVHRVGKKMENRCRPIIARFISREDRNQIWQNRGKIKHSDNYPDAYITEDFTKAIQDERRVLIKAMMKARENEGHPNAKVVGRYLLINNEKYDYKNIPSYLQ